MFKDEQLRLKRLDVERRLKSRVLRDLDAALTASSEGGYRARYRDLQGALRDLLVDLTVNVG